MSKDKSLNPTPCGKCGATIGWDRSPNPRCHDCEREEDRAAILDAKEFAYDWWLTKYAVAIARAERREGQ